MSDSSPSAPVRIVLAEDQHLIRQALLQLLQSNPRYEIAAAAANGREVLRFLDAAAFRPDLCIMDIQMPELDGIDCSVLLKERFPELKLMLLTSHSDESYLERGMLAEIDGYILKDSSPESFVRSVELVLDGHFVAPSALIRGFSRRYRELAEQERTGNFEDKIEALHRYGDLDRKEIELVRFIWLGWTNRMIAEDLYISEGTVKNNLTRIYRKLKIGSRAELLNLLGAASR